MAAQTLQKGLDLRAAALAARVDGPELAGAEGLAGKGPVVQAALQPAFGQLARTNNTMIVPGNVAEVSGLIGTAMALMKAPRP